MTALETRPFSLSLSEPLSTAAGPVETREGWLVRVEAEGAAGVGEATPLPGWTESREECRAALDRAAERAELEGLEAALAGFGGAAQDGAPAARHGVALALADRKARAAGEPLARHLGANEAVASVPANATMGDAPAGETADRAAAAVADGFDCLKVKVGARSVEADLRRLRAVREAVGDGPTLRADANGAWSPAAAGRAVAALADLGVEYVEQPLPADALDGHRELRGREVGIAVDETLVDHPVEDVVALGVADVVVLKPMVLGGPFRARLAALGAMAGGLTPVVTTTVDAAVARAGAVHLAASLPDPPPSGLATGGLLAEDLCPDPAPVTDGRVAVPDRNGHGAGAAWGE